MPRDAAAAAVEQTLAPDTDAVSGEIGTVGASHTTEEGNSMGEEQKDEEDGEEDEEEEDEKEEVEAKEA
jgi:hypothetical protein